MIRLVPIPNIGYVANDALSARVVLSRARSPLSRVLDVNLSRRMNKAQRHARQGRDRVLFVVDVSEMKITIYIIGERLIAYLYAGQQIWSCEWEKRP